MLLIIGFFIKKALPKYISETASRYKIRKFVNLFIYLLIGIIVFASYSKQLAGFAVIVGVAGVGIAFALQEIIVSLFGYLTIHFAKFFKVGDRVRLGGIKGDVVDIGLLRTSLMELGEWVDGDLYNGRITMVANSFIFKEPVYNYSGDFPFLWDELFVPIRTDCDFEHAKDAFLKIAEETVGNYSLQAKKEWDKMTGKLMIEKAKIEPQVYLRFDANWITITLRYVVDYKSRRTTKDELSRKILHFVNNSNGRVQIAIASMEVFPIQQKQENSR